MVSNVQEVMVGCSAAENKSEIVSQLETLLKLLRNGVEKLSFDEEKETIKISFEGGGSREVNVAGDSGYALIKDVIAKI